MSLVRKTFNLRRNEELSKLRDDVGPLAIGDERNAFYLGMVLTNEVDVSQHAPKILPTRKAEGPDDDPVELLVFFDPRIHRHRYRRKIFPSQRTVGLENQDAIFL